ncbi:MAG: OadG family protein [Bryobacterales bacterium]|nr:OadG family protein [Bryobacterales bacterium]
MRTRIQTLLALLLCTAAIAMAQANAPVPVHPRAEIEMGGPVALAVMLLVVGMIAVFSGLFAIYLFLIFLRKLSDRRTVMVSAENSGDAAEKMPVEVTSEMASAIALALYMDLRTFDEGTAEEITIRKITRPFSPWWNAAKTQIIFDNVEMFRRK